MRITNEIRKFIAKRISEAELYGLPIEEQL